MARDWPQRSPGRDRPAGDRGHGDRGSGGRDRGYGDRNYSDRGRSDRGFGGRDRGYGSHGPGGGRDRPRDDRGRGGRDRPWGGGDHGPQVSLPPGKDVAPLGANLFLVREGTRARPATTSLVPGSQVYEERLVSHEGRELRVWDPFRSKFSAAILKGCTTIPFKRDSRVLYLGAASGTTVSHISDIVENGVVYAVEFAPRSMRDLFRVAERRRNIVPILADARSPARYADIVGGVDVVYQDVAQPDQADIAVANARAFMPEGILVLMIKARSVDVSQSPSRVFADQMATLKAAGLAIVEMRHLGPFEKDHAAVVARTG